MLKHVSASIWNDSDSPEYIVARFKHAKCCSNIYDAKTSFILNCFKAKGLSENQLLNTGLRIPALCPRDPFLESPAVTFRARN